MKLFNFVIILMACTTGLACAQDNGEISTTVYVETGNMFVFDAWADESTRVHEVIEGPAAIDVSYQPHEPFFITYINDEGAECTVQHYPPLQENLLPHSNDDFWVLFSFPKYQRIFELPWVAEHLTDTENIMDNDMEVLKDAYLVWELRWREVRRAANACAQELYNDDASNATDVAESVAEFLAEQNDIVRGVNYESNEITAASTIVRVNLAGYGWEKFMIGKDKYKPKPIEPFTPTQARHELKSLELLSRTDTTRRIHFNYGNNGDRQTGELAEKRIREEG